MTAAVARAVLLESAALLGGEDGVDGVLGALAEGLHRLLALVTCLAAVAERATLLLRGLEDRTDAAGLRLAQREILGHPRETAVEAAALVLLAQLGHLRLLLVGEDVEDELPGLLVERTHRLASFGAAALFAELAALLARGLHDRSHLGLLAVAQVELAEQAHGVAAPVASVVAVPAAAVLPALGAGDLLAVLGGGGGGGHHEGDAGAEAGDETDAGDESSNRGVGGGHGKSLGWARSICRVRPRRRLDSEGLLKAPAFFGSIPKKTTAPSRARSRRGDRNRNVCA